MIESNLPSITIETFLKIIEIQLSENNYRPIFGLGKGGIGKTEAVCDLAKSLNIGYIDVRLLLYSEIDLKGIPYPNAEHTKTIWLQNNILPTVERNGAKGILVFDEITSCARSVRTAAYQLLNERRLGEYVLPEGWLVVCLGNGEDDGGDYQGMEGNFANRCSVFNITHNLDAWKNWALKHNINELVTAYVSFKPSDLHSYDPNNETELLFASPRSWKAVSDILNYGGYKDGDEVQSSRIVGNLGQRVGYQFMTFCKYKNQTVDPMMIIEQGLKFNTDNVEILYITIQSVVKIISGLILKDYNNGAYTQDTLVKTANAFKWLFGLKLEYAIMGYQDLIRSTDKLVINTLLPNPVFNQLCPEFLQFVHNNYSVFS